MFYESTHFHITFYSDLHEGLVSPFLKNGWADSDIIHYPGGDILVAWRGMVFHDVWKCEIYLGISDNRPLVHFLFGVIKLLIKIMVQILE